MPADYRFEQERKRTYSLDFIMFILASPAGFFFGRIQEPANGLPEILWFLPSFNLQHQCTKTWKRVKWGTAAVRLTTDRGGWTIDPVHGGLCSWARSSSTWPRASELALYEPPNMSDINPWQWFTNDAMGDTKMFLFFPNVSTINAFVSGIVLYGIRSWPLHAEERIKTSLCHPYWW